VGLYCQAGIRCEQKKDTCHEHGSSDKSTWTGTWVAGVHDFPGWLLTDAAKTLHGQSCCM
jgi:hypothetical protein